MAGATASASTLSTSPSSSFSDLSGVAEPCALESPTVCKAGRLVAPSAVSGDSSVVPQTPAISGADLLSRSPRCPDEADRISTSFRETESPIEDRLLSAASAPTISRSAEDSETTTLQTESEASYVMSELSRPNQIEALVRPGEHTITDDVLLLRTPYAINTKHMALICTHCKHAVSADGAVKHAHKFHPQCAVPRSFAADLTMKYPGLAVDKINPSETQEPIFGLAVPAEKYVVCNRCFHGYASLGSWRSHICAKAEVDLNGQQPYFLSFVQTFFRGPRLCYFPIKAPVPETDGPHANDYDLFKSQRADVDVREDEVLEPENYRELSQFLSKEGWVAHVAGCSKSELSALVSLPKPDEYLEPVVDQVFQLMSNIQSVIAKAGFHVRRLLGRRPSYVLFLLSLLLRLLTCEWRRMACSIHHPYMPFRFCSDKYVPMSSRFLVCVADLFQSRRGVHRPSPRCAACVVETI